MRLSILTTISILILSVPVSGVSGWFGPSNYDECILKSMKGANSNTAASLIRQSCRNKFPEKKKRKDIWASTCKPGKSKQLTREELAQIKVVNESGPGWFSVGIYNNTANIALTSVTINYTVSGVGTSLEQTEHSTTKCLLPNDSWHISKNIPTFRYEDTRYRVTSVRIVSLHGYPTFE